MPEPIVEQQQVSAEFSGMRLDQVAVRLFPGYSRARLQHWISSGALTTDGQAGKSSQRLTGGETLRLEARLESDGEVAAQDLPLDVVFEDDHIILVNKPAGLVVHPAAGHPDGTLQNALLHFDPGLETLPRAGIVHRLDKDTTGIMVVARNLKAHASLVEQLQSRSMSRVYETVVHGQVEAGDTVDAPIGRNPNDRQRMAVVAAGKPAVSHFRVLHAFRHFSHLEVSLESGRTHQIRVHLKHIGLPLVGDPTYGRRAGQLGKLPEALLQVISSFPRQALHARTLKLRHPASGEAVSHDAPLPEDFRALLTSLADADNTD